MTSTAALTSVRLSVQEAHECHADRGTVQVGCALCVQVGATAVTMEDNFALIDNNGNRINSPEAHLVAEAAIARHNS